MIETVLVAVDDSPLGVDALAYALETFPEATIVATHVASLEHDMLPPDTEELFEADPNETNGIGDELAQEVFERIRSIATDGAESTVRVSFLTGDPATRLVEYAEKGPEDGSGFDQVVMGTHGRDGVSRLLIGSVAETVLRKVSVPVTLIK